IHMKKTLFSLIIVSGLTLARVWAAEEVKASAPPETPAAAPAAAGAKADPNVEQRIADLEAYVNNAARGADAADAKITSKIGGAGPGHNAWMMTSAALVLFMTLPGLALFYGGLVRRKNVRSVVAQSLGTTRLVAILWWLYGYTLAPRPVIPRHCANTESTFFRRTSPP